jgi:hypothetical protein
MYHALRDAHGNDARAPEVQGLLDAMVGPLTELYVAGDAAGQERKELLALLAEIRDGRSEPALAKALEDYLQGSADEEVVEACGATLAMLKAGVKLDPALVSALWSAFSRFRLSQARNRDLFLALTDTVRGVSDPSYGDKAIEMLGTAAVPAVSGDAKVDDLFWLQLAAVDVLGNLRYAKAIRPLVVALLTPPKHELMGSIKTALLKMAREAEPELVKALDGSDPEYVAATKLSPGFPEQEDFARLASVLGGIGRPAGRGAVLRALATEHTDLAREWLARALVHMPSDPRNEAAFLSTYRKLSWKAEYGPGPRATLAQESAEFYDPKLVDWLLGETKGPLYDSQRAMVFEATVKLMMPDRQHAVEAALTRLRKDAPMAADEVQGMFEAASAALAQCKTDASCYVGVLGEPIPSSPPTALQKQVKAAWMVGILAGPSTRDALRAKLLERVGEVRQPIVRAVTAEAIDHLAPDGSEAAAEALERIVLTDRAAYDARDDKQLKIVPVDQATGSTGDVLADLVSADETLTEVALRLRARP